MRHRMKYRKVRQAGSVMVLALLVTMIILGVGLTVMWVSSSGMKVSGNITRRQEALYAAESGIERARAILTADLDWQTMLLGCPTAEEDSDKGNILCLAGAKLQNVRIIDNSTVSNTKITGAGTGLKNNATYTVWIRNDWMDECDSSKSKASQVQCDDGSKSSGSTSKSKAMYEDNNRRVIIRSEGIGRDGVSYVALEVILTGATGGSVAGDYSQIGGNAQGTHSKKGTSVQ